MSEEEEYEDEEEFDEEAAALQAERIEVLRPVIENLNVALEEIGLYVEEIGVGASLADDDIIGNKTAKEIVESGEGMFVIIGTYRIKKVAWTDRVLDPEGYALRTQVDSTVTVETHLDRAREASEQMKRTLEGETQTSDE